MILFFLEWSFWHLHHILHELPQVSEEYFYSSDIIIKVPFKSLSWLDLCVCWINEYFYSEKFKQKW